MKGGQVEGPGISMSAIVEHPEQADDVIDIGLDELLKAFTALVTSR
jgi:hypothetical protein